MKKIRLALVYILLVSLFSFAFRVPSSTWAKEFSDVPRSHWAYAAINWLTDQGIMQGYPDGTFRPDDPIKRSDMAVIATRFFGTGTVRPDTPSYDDVSSTHPAYPYIELMQITRLLEDSISNNMFRPDTSMTRIEFITFAVRFLAMKYFADIISEKDINDTLQRFTDMRDIPQWGRSYLTIAVHAHLINGYPDGSFRPNVALKRSEIAHMLYEILYYDGSDDGKTKPHHFTDVRGGIFQAIFTRKLFPCLFYFSGESYPGGTVEMVLNQIPLKPVSVDDNGKYQVTIPICFIVIGEVNFNVRYLDRDGANLRTLDFKSANPFELFPNWYRAYHLSYYPLKRLMVYHTTLAIPVEIEIHNRTTGISSFYDIEESEPFSMEDELQAGTNYIDMVLRQDWQNWKISYGLIITVT